MHQVCDFLALSALCNRWSSGNEADSSGNEHDSGPARDADLFVQARLREKREYNVSDRRGRKQIREIGPGKRCKIAAEKHAEADNSSSNPRVRNSRNSVCPM